MTSSIADEDIRMAKVADEGECEQFACRSCPQLFGSRNLLFKHIRLAHSEAPARDSDVAQIEVENVLSKGGDVRLYCVAGRHRSKTLSSTEYYSFKTESWYDGPFLLENRGSHGSISLSDGSVLVLSGGGLHTNLVSCETIAPEREDGERIGWVKASSMSVERHALATCHYKGSGGVELVFAVGGWKDGRLCSKDVEKYDVNKETWEILSSMQLGRRLCSCVAIKNATDKNAYRLYVFGGQIDNSNHLGFVEGEESNGWVTASVEVFDSLTQKWNELKDLPAAGPTSAIVVGENTIYVFVHGAFVYRYFPGEDKYIKVATLPLKHWYSFDICSFGRRIFMTGGSVHGRWSTACWEFDTISLKFKEMKPMAKERRRGSCAVVATKH